MTVTNNEDELNLLFAKHLSSDYEPLSIIVFNGFHGQEEGEDPEYDKYCERKDKALEDFKSALQTLITKSVVAELKRLEARTWFTVEDVQNILDERILSLEQSLNRTEG